MPLDRAHITAASRRMLPTYPLFFAVVGAGMLLTPLDRLLQTPVFRYADEQVSVRAWGVGFLILALAFVVALIWNRRTAYQVALCVAIFWMGVWASVTAGAAMADMGSFAAWAWPAFVARACWASLISLETRET